MRRKREGSAGRLTHFLNVDLDIYSKRSLRPQEGITVALTNDRHFEQEGFRALFRE